MKKPIILWPVLLINLLLTKTKADTKICSRSEICHCFNNSDHYEFQCSTNEEEEIVIHVYPDSLIRIECQNVELLNARKLPNVKFKNPNRLDIRYCPVPLDGLKDIVDHFGVNNLNYLSFEYGIFENSTLQTDTFAGLPNVTVLRLRDNDLRTIEDRFFDNFPNLLSLELDQNHLSVENNSLSVLSNLKFLSLLDNNLKDLPDGALEGMKNLERLNLWKNNLTEIDRGTFKGLKSLKSLELANNQLSNIEENSFDELTSLVNISIRSNLLENLSRKVFKSTELLENIEIGGNTYLNLLDKVFSNFQFLKQVELSRAGLRNIPEGLFDNSTNLLKISLSNNEIEILPIDTFKDLKELKILSISYNKITSLNDTIFNDVSQLEILNLSHNKLEDISKDIFKTLIRLKELDLSFNNIKTIHLNSFIRNKALTKISISHNRYVYKTHGIYPVSPFNKCGDLQEIDLSHNEIEDFPEDLMLLVSMKSIDLSWNNISYLRVNSLWKVTINEFKINLKHNQIPRLDFDNVELTAIHQTNLDAYHNVGSSVVIEISQNPFVCDCFAVDFARYINGEMYPGVRTAINFVYEDLNCTSPDILKDFAVKDVKPLMLTCPVGDIFKNFSCTDVEACGCVWRRSDYTILIDCHGIGLTSLPEIHLPRQLNYNRTEVYLEDNFLRRAPSIEDAGYYNVSKLVLRNNLLSEIDWIPPKIEILDLSSNKLQNIQNDILDIFNSTDLREISLGNNPWTCDCAASNLTNFLRQHVHQVDTGNILCEGSSKPLVNLSDNDLCPQRITIYLASATVLVLVLCIVSCLAAFYYKFQQEIKVWMYAHNILLFLIEEEDLDKDKIYDAFVSYSHKDQEFVEEKLISILEGGPDPYKLCIHVRNWIPGELISTQITTSVRDSKRTLVILSPGFLESVWGKMEFRTAHSEAMKEGRARVIIVLYGDIDMDSLDDELKAYMKTNTYIKWGDPWFWDKLKYALPHSKTRGKSNNTQKHANMMKYIDDKFSLINGKTPSDFNSTVSICSESGKNIDCEDDLDENSVIKHETV